MGEKTHKLDKNWHLKLTKKHPKHSKSQSFLQHDRIHIKILILIRYMLRSQYFGRRNDRSPTKTKINKQTTKKQNLLSLASLILTELSYHYIIPLKKYDSKNNDSFQNKLKGKSFAISVSHAFFSFPETQRKNSSPRVP